MNICGIIAEYNPFHNGHKYQIETIKKETGCDAIVAIMSGNFTQRGEPASFDKWTRAKMAIENGIDVVIELPTCYATSSSEFFALGGVGILNSLNSISTISFGAENDDLSLLTKIAKILIEEPEEYKNELQKNLKKGLSYPVARSNSLCEYLKKEIDKKELEELLLNPNNILAIEYIKALEKYNSNIKPHIVKRLGTPYNSEIFNSELGICSSTAIRNKLEENQIEFIKDYIPSNVFNIIKELYINGKSQMKYKNFEKEILYNLRKKTNEDLAQIQDVSEGIENVIQKSLLDSFDIETLIDSLKSKRYTRTRIQRILIHSLLDITSYYMTKVKYTPQYARVIAVSSNGKKVLSELSKNSKIPIVTNIAKFMKEASDEQKEMMNLDILTTNIYTLGYEIPKFRENNLDFTMPLI